MDIGLVIIGFVFYVPYICNHISGRYATAILSDANKALQEEVKWLNKRIEKLEKHIDTI